LHGGIRDVFFSEVNVFTCLAATYIMAASSLHAKMAEASLLNSTGIVEIQQEHFSIHESYSQEQEAQLACNNFARRNTSPPLAWQGCDLNTRDTHKAQWSFGWFCTIPMRGVECQGSFYLGTFSFCKSNASFSNVKNDCVGMTQIPKKPVIPKRKQRTAPIKTGVNLNPE